MDTNTLFTMALGLQAPWEVKNLQFDEEAKRLDIAVDFTRGADFPCPVCGQAAKVHDTEDKTWRHLDFFQHSVYLTARVPRCKCDAHGVKQVQVPWARRGSGFTVLFEALIMALVKVKPVAVVARLVGENDTRIWRLTHHHVDGARAKVDMSEVTRIGVDETAARRGQNYITLVMDMVTKKVLFGVEGRSYATLGAFRTDLLAHKGDPARIEEVCLAMSPAFIKGLRTYSPEAHLTFDRSHVMQLINKAVDEVRRSEAKGRPELMKTRYIWLKNTANLKANQAARLQELRDANLLTAEAYRMKLTLQDFYEQANPMAAGMFLKEWITMVRASGLRPMVKAAETLQEHMAGVLRWFKSGLANGLLEGINSLRQAAKSKARGYRTIRNLITMAYLIAGKLDFNLAPARGSSRF
jgi:transposase